jgi:protein involved in polysaccharide export with SLBB domain
MLQQQLSARNQILAQQQVDRLRAMRPEGRVALEMAPKDRLLPEILLEDGDEIVVPTMPSSIFVAGAVLNENALRFRPGRGLAEVIRQAGATPTADVDQAFVLRADGSAWLPELVKDDSIWSANTLLGWARKEQSRDEIALMPGDTVIVPEKLIRESAYSAFARGLKDWTQIIYQLGLGAAAVRTLK